MTTADTIAAASSPSAETIDAVRPPVLLGPEARTYVPDAANAATMRSNDAGAAVAADAATLAPADPGRYTVDGELARGGLGRILRAFDHRLARSVAIKEMLAESAEGEVRFRREAMTTARLQHPAIVPVHDAGQWPGGKSFFAMKYVAGESLDVALRDKQTLAERLALLPHVIAACDAIAYAHNEQVIHRDIKPANVLIGPFGETVVIDWGLAKDLVATNIPDVSVGPYRANAAPRLGETVAGSVMGTPAYMPPEQARGEQVDARADVYSLGALLYQLLCGAPPYLGRTADEVMDAVVAGGPKPLATSVPDIAPELVAIVERAMARAPQDRYPTARELAEELRAFQAGKLVGSHRYTARELIRRWVRKHRGIVAAVAIALVVLAIVGVYSFQRIVSERDRADAEAATSERRRAETETALRASIESRDALALETARGQLDRDPTMAIATLSTLSDAGLTSAARHLAEDAVVRGTARIYPGAERRIARVETSPDGRLAATIEEDGALRLWNLETGLVAQLATNTHCALFTPDGKRLVEVSDGDVGVRTLADRTRRVIGRNVERYSRSARVVCARLPDGEGIVIGSLDGVVLWNLSSSVPRRLPDSQYMTDVAVSADGTRIAAAGRQLALWELASDRVTRAPIELPFARAPALQFSPDGTWVAIAGVDGRIDRWDTSTLRSAPIATRTPEVNSIAFTADNGIAAGCEDGTLITYAADGSEQRRRPLGAPVLDVATSRDAILARTRTSLFVIDRASELQRELRGHRDWLTGAASLPDRSVLTASADHTLRRWNPRAGVPRSARLGTIDTWVAVSPDLQTVAFGGKELELVEVATDRRRRLPVPKPVDKLAFSHDGRTLALVLRSELQLQPIAGGPPQVERVDGPIFAVFAAGDGFVVTTEDGVVVFPRAGGRRAICPTKSAMLQAIAGGGTHLVLADIEGSDLDLVICTLATGEMRRLHAPNHVKSIAISHDGKRIVAGLDNGTLRIWDGATHRDVRGADNFIPTIALSPDGKWLASTSDDSIVQITSLEDPAAKPVHLTGHTGNIRVLAWSPDGTKLLGADENEVREWDVASTFSITLRIEGVISAAYHAAGFAMATQTGGIHVWSSSVPRDAAGLRRWLSQSAWPIR